MRNIDQNPTNNCFSSIPHLRAFYRVIFLALNVKETSGHYRVNLFKAEATFVQSTRMQRSLINV